MKENEENCFKNVKYGIEGCHIMDAKNKTMEQCQESIINLILQNQGDNGDYKKETEFSNISNIAGKNYPMKCHKNTFRYIFCYLFLM